MQSLYMNLKIIYLHLRCICSLRQVQERLIFAATVVNKTAEQKGCLRGPNLIPVFEGMSQCSCGEVIFRIVHFCTFI